MVAKKYHFSFLRWFIILNFFFNHFVDFDLRIIFTLLLSYLLYNNKNNNRFCYSACFDGKIILVSLTQSEWNWYPWNIIIENNMIFNADAFATNSILSLGVIALRSYFSSFSSLSVSHQTNEGNSIWHKT